MGLKGGSAPQAPDPYETAKTESQFNRPDTYGPGGGGVRQGYTDANGQFVQGVAPEGFQSAQQYVESDFEKGIRQLLEPASTQLTTQFIDDNVTNLSPHAQVQDFSGVAQDLFDAGYERMAPQFEMENDRLMTNLQARGLPVGSDAFKRAYAQQQQTTNDALRDLTMQATSMAGAEQSRQYGLDADQRARQVAELSALMGHSYQPPNMTPTGSTSPVNYSSNVQNEYNAKMAQYNQQQQNNAAMWNTAGSLGGAMIGKSDRRAKTGIVRVGHRQGIPVYAFRYHEDAPNVCRIGYMAQDIQRIAPSAVIEIEGVLHVDYAQLPEVEIHAA